MTATTGTPLDNLARQIARQQAELEALQQEFQSRQARLADLNEQKAALQSQLQQIEADIRAANSGGPVRPASSSRKGSWPQGAGKRGRPRKDATSSGTASGMPRANTLPALLLDIMQGASAPMTARQLTDEVVRRKFPTTSSNLAAMVETRVHDLVRKNLLHRAKDQPGYVAGSTRKASPAPKSVSKNGAMAKGPRQPLRVVVANVLAKSQRPMTVHEISDAVLKGGYQTKSKNFVDVLWVVLGHIKNVRNVPGKGYMMKR